MLELKNVSKAYQTKHGLKIVLDDVSLKFPPGENVGILGRNGAGKSTLLRLIGGAEQPDSGRVIRKGRVSWPIGFQGGLHGELTGEDNCRFIARLYQENQDAVIEEARTFADIGDYFYMPLRTYSSGMRAKLAFGLSMAIDFEVYLVDEVTAVGDQKFQDKCRKAFKEREAFSSVIIVSHQLKTIRQYCQRCAVLHEGKLVMCESVDEAERLYREAAA